MSEGEEGILSILNRCLSRYKVLIGKLVDIILIFLFICVIINYVNIKVPYINPPEKINEILIPISYPPTGAVLTVNPETIYIELILRYKGNNIVEREPVQLYAAGTLSPQLAKQIDSISVGFKGALPYIRGYIVRPIGPPFGSVLLKPIEKSPLKSLSLGAGLYGEPIEIYWPLQGDYHPIIIIHFKNNTIIQYDYDYFLHISSIIVKRQERYNRINFILSFVIFIFSVVQAIPIVIKLWRGEWR